jgi:hypothetical protein
MCGASRMACDVLSQHRDGALNVNPITVKYGGKQKTPRESKIPSDMTEAATYLGSYDAKKQDDGAARLTSASSSRATHNTTTLGCALTQNPARSLHDPLAQSPAPQLAQCLLPLSPCLCCPQPD